MKKIVQRIYKARWTYRQSLTKKPKNMSTKISDLFVWRSSSKWETFFELVDIASLFENKTMPRNYVDIVFFNSNGETILQRKIELIKNRRQVINISNLLSKVGHIEKYGEVGAFAIFHSNIPKIIPKLSSFIAERGYVSYKYKDNPLRSYVHGNLDAISMCENNINTVGGRGFLTRKYNLQYELKGGSVYELGIVNSSNKNMLVECEFTPINGGPIVTKLESINSKGVKVFSIGVDPKHSYRAIMSSKLIMTRPLVFRINEDYFDVFHG